jgi:hypothetical protein
MRYEESRYDEKQVAEMSRGRSLIPQSDQEAKKPRRGGDDDDDDSKLLIVKAKITNGKNQSLSFLPPSYVTFSCVNAYSALLHVDK